MYFWWLHLLKLVEGFRINFAKIYIVYIQTSRNFKLVGFANNSAHIIC